MKPSISDRHLALPEFGLSVALANPDSLRVTPAERITPAAREYLITHKQALLNQLRAAANDTGDPIPDDLAGLVLQVATLEGWPQDLQIEHLAIIRRQLAAGECDADTIRTGWQAHIDRWYNLREAIEERAAIMEYDGGHERQQAESLAATDNQCLSCRHWQGEHTAPDDRAMALSLVGVKQTPRASKTLGICGKRYKPWRVSNIPGHAQYGQWHYIGQCNRQDKEEVRQAA